MHSQQPSHHTNSPSISRALNALTSFLPVFSPVNCLFLPDICLLQSVQNGSPERKIFSCLLIACLSGKTGKPKPASKIALALSLLRTKHPALSTPLIPFPPTNWDHTKGYHPSNHPDLAATVTARITSRRTSYFCGYNYAYVDRVY